MVDVDTGYKAKIRYYTTQAHLQAKEIQINGIIQSCVFASSNEVLAQIKMETLLKLYYSCVIPALLYGCETWILDSPEIKHLNRIQVNTLRKILKLLTYKNKPILTMFNQYFKPMFNRYLADTSCNTFTKALISNY